MQTTIQSLLVCPITRQHLLPLSPDKTAQLIIVLEQQRLYYIDGSQVSASAEQIQFLITENQHHLYSVIQGVPILLESKQIKWSKQINSAAISPA